MNEPNGPNGPNGDQLDKLLRGWADRHATDPQSLDRIHGAIRQAMDNDGGPSLTESTIAAAPRRRPHRALWLSIAAVAAMLLVILSSTSLPLFSPKRTQIALPNPPEDNGDVQAAITPEQLAHETKLFAELDRMFGRQLRWIAESDGSIEMGIEPDATTATQPANSNPVTIRFTVAKRGQGERDWSVIWTVNLVARNEQLVQLQPAKANSPSLLVWAFTLPDGKIACDAELSFGGSDGLHVSASELQSAGDVREVASAEEGGVEYRVYQAVQLLDDEVI